METPLASAGTVLFVGSLLLLLPALIFQHAKLRIAWAEAADKQSKLLLAQAELRKIRKQLHLKRMGWENVTATAAFGAAIRVQEQFLVRKESRSAGETLNGSEVAMHFNDTMLQNLSRRLQIIPDVSHVSSCVDRADLLPAPTCKKVNAFKNCGMWKIVSGSCTTTSVNTDCLMSPQFGHSTYSPNDHCTIEVYHSRSHPIAFTHWDVGAGDYLEMGTAKYTSTQKPPLKIYMALKSTLLTWSSTSGGNGWKLCPMLPTNPSQDEKTLIKDKGSCVVDADGRCAKSSGFLQAPDSFVVGNIVVAKYTGTDTNLAQSYGNWYMAKVSSDLQASGYRVTMQETPFLTFDVPKQSGRIKAVYPMGDICSIWIRGKQSLEFKDRFCSPCSNSLDITRKQSVSSDDTTVSRYCGWSDVAMYPNYDICFNRHDKTNSPGLFNPLSVDFTSPMDSNKLRTVTNTAGHAIFEAAIPILGVSDGWRFCLLAEDRAWQESVQCPRTCGGCIDGYEDDLLKQCIDDPWFEQGIQACSHFAQLGTGKPSGYTGNEKCTADSALGSLQNWQIKNQDATIAAVDVDRIFAKRLQQHCPFSCKICERCGQGRYVDRSNTLSVVGVCKDCAAGRYSDEEQLDSCKTCPGGRSNNGGSSTCAACDAGKFASSLVPQACTACPAGRMMNRTGQSECDICLGGTYQPDTGSQTCLQCEEGKFNDGTVAAVACTNCANGTYNTGVGAKFCRPCAAGRFSQNGGICQDCTVGRYSSNSGSPMCTKCSMGLYGNALGMTQCSRCIVGMFSNGTGMTSCFECPLEYTTAYSGSTGLDDCICGSGTYNLEHTTICAPCPPAFTCPGGHRYGDAELDVTPLLDPGYMSLPDAPLKAFTCQGLRTVCGGSRTPMFRTTAGLWSQVCGGGRIERACAVCPLKQFKTSTGCDQCSGFDSALFWFSMPVFLAGLIGLHVMWNRPSVKERADRKAAVVCVNLYLLYSQILGVFQTVRIDWKPPFKQFLEFSSYLRLRLDFLKPSCGLRVSPTRDYITRGLLPLCGMGALWSAFLFCTMFRKVAPRLEERFALPLRSWLYYVNTTGSIYMLFSSGIALTSFLPWQCIDNPGSSPASNHEWPNVACKWDDSNYAVMSTFAFFLIFFYILTFPMICLYQVIRYPVAIATDPHFFTKYKFLFHHYHAEARFFSMIIMARNVSLSMISVFLQRDTFFQIICMMLVMICYLTVTSLVWPWAQYHVNWLDICGSIMLCGIMAIGSGFIENSINQDSLLVLLSVIFVSLLLVFVSTVSYYMLSHVGGRYDYTVFLSHAKGTGGAVARLFKTLLSPRLASASKIFVDSDNLLSLNELHVFVQHTRNLVLLLTPNCFAREWVAVEIVTTFIHHVHAIMVSINEGVPPDDVFVDSIPSVFRSNLVGRFPSLGITVDLLKAAFTSIQDAPMLSFDVYSSMETQEDHIEELVGQLSLGNGSLLKSRFLHHVEAVADYFEAVGANNQRKKLTGNAAKEDITEFTRLFICRDKRATVQQEASVLCLKLELNSLLSGSVYLSPCTYSFPDVHERITKLQGNSAILFCLTETVLSCVSAICEVVAGVQRELFVVPVQIDTDFPYPGDAFYHSMSNGEVLNLPKVKGVDLLHKAFANLLKTLFEEIALPFNANANSAAIKIAAQNVGKRYSDCQQQTVVGQLLCRLNDLEAAALSTFIIAESKNPSAMMGMSNYQNNLRTNGIGHAPHKVAPKEKYPPLNQASRNPNPYNPMLPNQSLNQHPVRFANGNHDGALAEPNMSPQKRQRAMNRGAARTDPKPRPRAAHDDIAAPRDNGRTAPNQQLLNKVPVLRPPPRPHAGAMLGEGGAMDMGTSHSWSPSPKANAQPGKHTPGGNAGNDIVMSNVHSNRAFRAF